MTYTSQKGSNVPKSLPFVLRYHRSTPLYFSRLFHKPSPTLDMAFLTNLLLLGCATLPLGLANPVPNPVAIPDPSPIGPIQAACTTSVHIDSQTKDVPGPVHGVGGTCTAGTAG